MFIKIIINDKIIKTIIKHTFNDFVGISPLTAPSAKIFILKKIQNDQNLPK